MENYSRSMHLCISYKSVCGNYNAKILILEYLNKYSAIELVTSAIVYALPPPHPR